MSCPACRTTYTQQRNAPPKPPRGQASNKDRAGEAGKDGGPGNKGIDASSRGKGPACCGSNGADGKT
jgi:hypothetical protein